MFREGPFAGSEHLVTERKVLLVEDEFLIRLVLAEVLSDAGYVVTAAVTADEAASLLDGAGTFDVVVTDIQTPGQLDGIGLARRVRQHDPDMRVVFMTGRPDAMRSAGKLGPRDAFIAKPYGPSDVVRTLDRLLAS